MERKKVADELLRTQSFSDRLKWKNLHYGTPTTSTPKRNLPSSVALTNKDIETCFGFDNSGDSYSAAFISPISVMKEKTENKRDNVKEVELVKGDHGTEAFNELVARYAITDDGDKELRFDSSTVKRTYTNKKTDHGILFHNIPLVKQKRLQKKRPRKTKNKENSSADDSDLDDDAKKWLEQKNKEFEDVQNVPLVVTKGNPAKRNKK